MVRPNDAPIPRCGYACLHRFHVSPSCLLSIRSRCVPTENWTWIGAKGNPNGAQRLRRWTLKGVPGKYVDLLLPEPDDEPEPLQLALEIGRKAGRYDGAERVQLVFRRWAGSPIPQGNLFASEEENCIARDPSVYDRAQEARQLVLAAVWKPLRHVYPPNQCGDGERVLNIDGGSWMEAFPMLLHAIDRSKDTKAILIWQWSTYYAACVPSSDLDSLIAEFKDAIARPECDGWTLNEANRLASRLLYRCAVQSGWRKLTKRERERLRFDAYWVRQEHVLKRAMEMGLIEGHPTGAGQYTLEAAAGYSMRGQPMDWDDSGEEALETSYGVCTVEG